MYQVNSFPEPYWHHVLAFLYSDNKETFWTTSLLTQYCWWVYTFIQPNNTMKRFNGLTNETHIQLIFEFHCTIMNAKLSGPNLMVKNASLPCKQWYLSTNPPPPPHILIRNRKAIVLSWCQARLLNFSLDDADTHQVIGMPLKCIVMAWG